MFEVSKARKIICLYYAVSDIFGFYNHFNVYWYSVEESWTHYKDWSQNHGWIHSDRTLQISCLLLDISLELSTPNGVGYIFHSTQNSGELLIFEYFSLWSG